MTPLALDLPRAAPESKVGKWTEGFKTVFKDPKIWQPLAAAYAVYSFKVLPWLGGKVADDADSYRYLAESIRMHPDQDSLKKMMEQAGLAQVEYFNLTAGVVALHRGYKL